jgi:alpha-D-ribose 1-methylphosphonate 5-triphosphate synthase subunit PhnH
VSAITLTLRASREQQTFRVLLNALARPGSIDRIIPHETGGEYAAALSAMEALVDHEVSFALLPERPGLAEAVLRQTGSRLAPLAEADYALCEAGSLAEALDACKEGTLEYPDRSATLICRVDSIEAGVRLALKGPGVRDTAYLAVAGLTDGAIAAFAGRNALPPLGIDVFFVAADGKVAGLPRYTRLHKEDN